MTPFPFRQFRTHSPENCLQGELPSLFLTCWRSHGSCLTHAETEAQRGHSAGKGHSRDSYPGPSDSSSHLVLCTQSRLFTHSAALHTQLTVQHRKSAVMEVLWEPRSCHSPRAGEETLAGKGEVCLLDMKTNLTSWWSSLQPPREGWRARSLRA